MSGPLGFALAIAQARAQSVLCCQPGAPGKCGLLGDVLTATTKTISVRETQGKQHRLLIRTSEMTFRNQAGEVVAIRRNTGVSW